jgi:hypothetical protein
MGQLAPSVWTVPCRSCCVQRHTGNLTYSPQANLWAAYKATLCKRISSVIGCRLHRVGPAYMPTCLPAYLPTSSVQPPTSYRLPLTFYSLSPTPSLVTPTSYLLLPPASCCSAGNLLRRCQQPATEWACNLVIDNWRQMLREVKK